LGEQQELEDDMRRAGKQIAESKSACCQAITDGNVAAAELLEAQQQKSNQEKRNEVLEKVNNIYWECKGVSDSACSHQLGVCGFCKFSRRICCG